jgi:thiol-disulfide isomerase/thioredoxin
MKHVFGLVLILIVLACAVLFLFPPSGVPDIVQNVNSPQEGDLEDLKSTPDADSIRENAQEESVLSCSTSSTSSVCVSNRSPETLAQAEPSSIISRQSAKTIPDISKKYIEFVNPSGFVNTNDESITLEQYVGKKVILLNVITYSCSNCQATFPYVNSWYEKYKEEGLIVIGLHTPEFAFEKKKTNVVDAMRQYGITYPVVMDNDYATWTAYGNRYWPRKYLIDIHGNIVYDHIGEGAYVETEIKIRELLAERKEVLDKDKAFEEM